MSLARPGRNRPPRPDNRKLRAGWLSLFAMLMIFIGPLVSQSMPMEHRAAMPAGMEMGMAGMDHGDSQHSASYDGNDAAMHVMWEKCGYCSLFFHCPALPQPVSLLTSEAVPASNSLTVQPSQGYPHPAFFPGARSRAPPSSLIV